MRWYDIVRLNLIESSKRIVWKVDMKIKIMNYGSYENIFKIVLTLRLNTVYKITFWPVVE